MTTQVCFALAWCWSTFVVSTVIHESFTPLDSKLVSAVEM